jgi:hypothetical protein
MSEPDLSDAGEIDDFPCDISCDDYSVNADSEDSRHVNKSPDIEIDMDSSPIQPLASIQPLAPIQPKKRIIAKKSIPITKTEPDSSLLVPKQMEKISSTPANVNTSVKIKEKTSKAKTESSTSAGNDKTKLKDKESAADSKFQFNDETIEYFCKDILGDVKKICVPNSSFNNDTALLCLLLKLQVFTEYKCIEKKCKTGKTWLGHPIQLLIHRKNGKMHDLTISNLELICPNCYIAKYGLDLFIKVIAKTIYTCNYCGYPLSNFTNSKKKERICMSCESKIMTSGYFEQRSQFINQLTDTIDEASTLKQDEFKSSNYYSQVSQFKSFDAVDPGGYKSTRKITASETSKTTTKTFNDKPIISLNLTVPNLDDLINEDLQI